MVFTIDQFQDEQRCIEDLEAAYVAAMRQQQNLIVRVGLQTYTFVTPMEREHRLKRWKQLFKETKPPD